jgi:hypothetical protein
MRTSSSNYSALDLCTRKAVYFMDKNFCASLRIFARPSTIHPSISVETDFVVRRARVIEQLQDVSDRAR